MCPSIYTGLPSCFSLSPKLDIFCNTKTKGMNVVVPISNPLTVPDGLGYYSDYAAYGCGFPAFDALQGGEIGTKSEASSPREPPGDFETQLFSSDFAGECITSYIDGVLMSMFASADTLLTCSFFFSSQISMAVVWSLSRSG